MAAGTSTDDAAVRYQAYSRLQAAALAMGETLPIPEIVVRAPHFAYQRHTCVGTGTEPTWYVQAIGGQSDGKSTLLEALLGVS